LKTYVFHRRFSGEILEKLIDFDIIKAMSATKNETISPERAEN